MTGFPPFQAHTILPAAGLNAALQDVDNDALAAGTAAAAAATEAATAETAATAAETEAAAALAAAQAAGGGTVKTVNGVGPDGTGNVTIATSSAPTMSRPSFSLFTDAISPGSSEGWSDDGTSYVIEAQPEQTYGSASAYVSYAGKTPPAYDAGTNTRTITAEILSSFPEADGVKVGLALHDPDTGTVYVVALGMDLNSIPGSVSSYYRPAGVMTQTVTGLSTGSGSKPQGTRNAGPVFSLQHDGRIWLRLVDTQNSGVTGAFSRDGTQWTPLPYILSYSYNGAPPAAPTWGIFADIGINNQADWYSAMYSPQVFAARILSFVES